MTGYFEAPGALTYGLGRVAGALQAFNPQPVTIVFCNMDNLPLMKVSCSAAVLCCAVLVLRGVIATQSMLAVICCDVLLQTVLRFAVPRYAVLCHDVVLQLVQCHLILLKQPVWLPSCQKVGSFNATELHLAFI